MAKKSGKKATKKKATSKKSSKKKSEAKSAPVSKERASDEDRFKELSRKASGNTLHAQQAEYYAHRINASKVGSKSSTSTVEDEDVVVED